MRYYHSPISLVTELKSPNGFFSSFLAFLAMGLAALPLLLLFPEPESDGVSVLSVNSFGVRIPGVISPS
jgi:hypothetical protein